MRTYGEETMSGKQGSLTDNVGNDIVFGKKVDGYIPPIEVLEVANSLDQIEGAYRVYQARNRFMGLRENPESTFHTINIEAQMYGTAQEVFDELRAVQALVNLALSIYGEEIKK
jgi:hypothetical protein